MISGLKQKILGIQRIAGLEMVLLQDGGLLFNYVILALKKNILTIEQKEQNLNSIEVLMQKISNDVPISIVINGRGIMHKKLIENFGNDSVKIISNILPNAKAGEFYFQEHDTGRGYFMSIIRKNTLDPLLQTFYNKGFFVLAAALGPFVFSNIRTLIGHTSEKITVGGHQLIFDNGILREYLNVGIENKDEESFLIGNEKISPNLLVSYSAAFQILSNSALAKIEVDSIKSSASDYKHKNIFKVFGWGVLLFFLSALLINFLLFSHFSEKNKELVAREGMYKGMVSSLDTLQKKVREKESFLLNAGWLEASKASLYADRVAALVPSSINLTELSVNPLNDKQGRIEKKIIFHNNTLKLSGHCNRTTDLNFWIKRIKSLDWVKSVVIQNYTFDNKEKIGNFNIVILLKQ